jgi:hypothetical protein
MRFFYPFWFFFCGGWGYLLSRFPHEEGMSWGSVFATFPVAIASLAILTFFGLRKNSVPVQSARLSIDLKPWQQPLGILQFVTATFLFSSVWGIGLSVFSQGANVLYPSQFLALAAGGLLGALAGCHAYRSTHVA